MTTQGLSRTGTIVTIACTLVGTLIGYLSLAASVKWPPFQPDAPIVSTTLSQAKSVTVFKGDNARDQPSCTHMSCAFISVELKGFPANASMRCTFDSSVGPSPFVDLQVKVDTSGSVRAPSTNYFGNPGGWVSATCDGVRGELNPW